MDDLKQSLQDKWMAHPSIGVDVAKFADATSGRRSATLATLTFNDPWESEEITSWGKDSYLKGGCKIKVNARGELSPRRGSAMTVGFTTNQGEKGEVELAKNALKKLLNTASIREDKETFNHEISKKQIKFSVVVKVTFNVGLTWFYPLLSGEFTVLAMDWEKLKKNPDSFTVGGLELGAGGKAQGMIDVSANWQAKVSLDATFTGSVKLNWEKIFQEVARKGVVETAESMTDAAMAATASAIDMALMAGPPLLAGIVMAQGIYAAGEKGALEEAILEGAMDARQAAFDYASTMTGSEGAGPGPRAKAAVAAAKDELAQVASTSHVSLDALMAELRKMAPHPDFSRIYAQARQRIISAYEGQIQGAIRAWRQEHKVLDIWTTEEDDIESARKKVAVVFSH